MINPANEVRLTGRVSQAGEERELPSGDRVVGFRLVVPRTKRNKSKQRVDVFDCTAWTAKVRRAAARFDVDDEVTVVGELRRSFRRSGGIPTSFVGVDVHACSRAESRDPPR